MTQPNYSLSIKIDGKHKTMAKIGVNKNGYLSVAFSPDFKAKLKEWLRDDNQPWLNFDLRDWNASPSQNSTHSEDSNNQPY